MQLSYAASSSHKKLVRLLCLNCKTTRRIPAPPLSQDDSDPPPGPESATQVDGAGTEGKRPKRKRAKKVVYKQPFFERPEHILFCGSKMVVKAEDLPPHKTATSVPEPVRTEADAASIPIG